jgi:hypothetical protein
VQRAKQRGIAAREVDAIVKSSLAAVNGARGFIFPRSVRDIRAMTRPIRQQPSRGAPLKRGVGRADESVRPTRATQIGNDEDEERDG